MTKLTDPQARALLDFALAQVQHLLPQNLEQELAPGLSRGHTQHAVGYLPE